MQRKSIIVYIKEVPEVYGNLKLLCDNYDVSYWTYSRKKFPFLLNGYEVHKVPFQSGAIEPQTGWQKENKTTTEDEQ